ncbi:lipopolysaccharide assembly protein LapA domain-containing protein [Streptomyces sp. CC208A]|uniref:lipopolysaccharide assembly protein LapA domain-containing protein n=1 Tax=Streptomyces sp. CC208A TaxID=3044573 RepID=UPI0024A850A8|nr:lipopolysaccharide assembly protein LapA domain-containing protein [Streptomyces sp. CC208A]
MSPKDTAGRKRERAGTITPGRIAIALVAVLLLVFIFENTGDVRIRLLIPEVTMPLYLALLATALLGALCGWYVARRGFRRNR